jgi:enoyl-CoA hydratase
MLSPDNEANPIAEEIVGSTLIVRFSRPAQRNSLSSETLKALAATIERLKTSPSVHVVIFTGSDNAFASGADIKELAELDPSQARDFSRSGQQLTNDIAALNQVTIAAINGFCMGGGLDFALACDIRIASKSAVFAHPGSKLGIITGWGGTQRLSRLIGKSKAIELFSTGRRFSSDEGLKAGLITQIADPVLEAALVIANTSRFTS